MHDSLCLMQGGVWRKQGLPTQPITDREENPMDSTIETVRDRGSTDVELLRETSASPR